MTDDELSELRADAIAYAAHCFLRYLDDEGKRDKYLQRMLQLGLTAEDVVNIVQTVLLSQAGRDTTETVEFLH